MVGIVYLIKKSNPLALFRKMSFTSSKISHEKNNLPVAIITGGDLSNSIIYLKEADEQLLAIKEAPVTFVQVPLPNKFEQMPNIMNRVVYIAAGSGAGKSTYASSYIRKYMLQNPKADLIVFSRLDDDKIIDELKGKRILVDESLITDPIEIEDIPHNSIILFDDCECLTNKAVLSAVNKIKMQLLELGRHMNIHVVITSHLINGLDRNMSKTILNEMASLTIFPSAGSLYAIRYVLKHYFSLSTKQINIICKIESRWITILKHYPSILISEGQLMFISTL